MALSPPSATVTGDNKYSLRRYRDALSVRGGFATGFDSIKM